ncbi:hypothetical protein HDU92_006730 [Lobulomyces angularis]|nr:hypothetical protein HDU92_006730 [Lobulomyces angularis]
MRSFIFGYIGLFLILQIDICSSLYIKPAEPVNDTALLPPSTEVAGLFPSSDQYYLLFPSFGTVVNNEVNIEVVGLALDPLPKLGKSAFIELANSVVSLVMNRPLSADETSLFKNTVNQFLFIQSPFHKVQLRVNEKTVNLGRTSLGGTFEKSVSIGRDNGNTKAVYNIEDSSDDTVVGEVYISPNTGFGIISDIDDTIKFSEVLNKKNLFKNTFLAESKSTPDSAEVYQYLKNLLNPSFHYLSGTPQVLLPNIRKFLKNSQFPEGHINLRELAILDGSVFELADANSTEDYKRNAGLKIVEKLNKKKFLLIGDSTEKDPEAYGEIARRNPQNILCIFIRRVIGVNAEKEKDLNADARFQNAFRDIDNSKIFIFDDFTQLKTLDIKNGQCKN